MSGPSFFQTVMGKKFYDRDVPAIVSELERISKELKRANDLEEQKLSQEESQIGDTELMYFETFRFRAAQATLEGEHQGYSVLTEGRDGKHHKEDIGLMKVDHSGRFIYFEKIVNG